MPYAPRAIVYTWGTKFGDSAYGHSATALRKGGNVGHASIALRFSADDRGKDLIKNYCTPNNIPYALKKSPTDKEEYYEVYFSYWPGSDLKYSLKEDLQSDQREERLGVNFNWKKELLRDKDIEIDRRGGRTLGPAMVIHNLPEDNPDLKKLLEDYALNFNKYRKIENNLWKVNREIKKANQKIKFYRKIKFLTKEKDFKKKLDKLEIQKKQIFDEKLAVRKKLNVIENEFKEKQVSLDKYITKASPPNNTVEIPIVDSDRSWNGKKGLDLEGILQGMVEVTKNKNGYGLYSNNCSAAVATVIHGGIPKSDKNLKRKFEAQGFLGISTPQTVFNAALKGQHYLYESYTKNSQDPENILQKFIKFLQKMVKSFQQEPEAPNDNPITTRPRRG